MLENIVTFHKAEKTNYLFVWASQANISPSHCAKGNKNKNKQFIVTPNQITITVLAKQENKLRQHLN